MPGGAGLPEVQKVTMSGSDYLSLSFNGSATDITYTVQATSDLGIPWTNIQTFPAGTAPGAVTVQDILPMHDNDNRFMRLQVSKP